MFLLTESTVYYSVDENQLIQLDSVFRSKDNTIRIWNSISGDSKELSNTSTLEFSSETETAQLTPADPQDTPPKLINPTVLPYIAVDVRIHIFVFVSLNKIEI